VDDFRVPFALSYNCYLSFSRPDQGSDTPTLRIARASPIAPQQQYEFAQMLNASSPVMSCSLDDLCPKVMRLPATGNVIVVASNVSGTFDSRCVIYAHLTC
jgi:hypothetical protein